MLLHGATSSCIFRFEFSDEGPPAGHLEGVSFPNLLQNAIFTSTLLPFCWSKTCVVVGVGGWLVVGVGGWLVVGVGGWLVVGIGGWLVVGVGGWLVVGVGSWLVVSDFPLEFGG